VCLIGAVICLLAALRAELFAFVDGLDHAGEAHDIPQIQSDRRLSLVAPVLCLMLEYYISQLF